MATLEQLIVQIEANTELLRRELSKAEGAVVNFGNKTEKQLGGIQQMFSKLGAAGRQALGLLGIGLSVQALSGFVRSAVQTADAIGDMAKQAGFGAENFQRLQFVFKQNGVEAGEFSNAMRQLNTRFGQFVQTGKGPLKATLDELGLTQRVLNGEITTSEQLFAAIVEAFGKIEGSAKGAAIAADLFGSRLGGKLAPTLAMTTEQLEKAKLAATGIFTDEQVTNADRLADSWGRISASLTNAAKGDVIDFLSIFGRAMGITEFKSTLKEQLAEAEALLKNFDEQTRQNAGPTGMVNGISAEVRAQGRRRLLGEIARIKREQLEWGDGGKPVVPAAAVGGAVKSGDAAPGLTAFIEMAQRAEALSQTLRTDAEKAAEELRIAGELLAENLISQDMYDRQAAELIKKGQPLSVEMEAFIEDLQAAEKLTKEMALDVETQTEKWKEMQGLLSQGLVSGDTATRMRDKLLPLIDLESLPDKMEVVDEALERSKEKAREFGTAFAAAFESRGMEALLGGDVRGAIRGFADDLAELILRITVLQPMAEQLSLSLQNIGKGAGGAGGGGGFFASLLGAFGLGKTAPTAASSGPSLGQIEGWAGGGRPSVGQLSIVGEKGPEWFVPDVAGTILNASQMSGRSGTVIRQTFHVQAGLPPQWEAQLVGVGQLAAASAYRAVSQGNRGQR